VPEAEIEKIKNELASGVNPKEIKMRLAREIVKLYHHPKAGEHAEEHWVKTFSEKEIPTDIDTITAREGVLLKDVLVENEIVPSKSEFTRLIGQGAIQNLTAGAKVDDPNIKVVPGTYKIGKKQFIKIDVK
jgi:tyrosyl-tRNA synthetase